MLTITSCEKVMGADAIAHMSEDQLKALEGRFWTKAEAGPDGCLEWTAAGNGWGYGVFGIAGAVASSHRVAFTLAKGPIPAGLLVRHRCHNRRCINPDHMQLGTHAENSRDAIEAGRLPTGPGSRPRKLTVEDAVAVVGAQLLGMTLEETADMLGVAPITVAHIRIGIRWVKAIAKHRDATRDAGPSWITVATLDTAAP